jgi:hypothetical protein
VSRSSPDDRRGPGSGDWWIPEAGGTGVSPHCKLMELIITVGR